jgi:hypothetical protein
MIPLETTLDDIDFDQLVDIARNQLPLLDDEWTDYNFSDPGITLIDLLAWIADSQIYSIARNRVDERTAMAALLGILPERAKPATGALFPTAPITEHQIIAALSRAIPIGAGAPRVEVATRVELWPVALVEVIAENGPQTIDLTASNVDARIAFPPFGAPPSSEAVLKIVLQGELANGRVSVSMGFELDDDSGDSPDDLGGLSGTVQFVGASETAAVISFDSTNRLRRSGVMTLDFDASAIRGQNITFRFRSTGNALLPQLRRVLPNALPVVQQATLSPSPFTGNARPYQRLTLNPDALFPPDEVVAERIWTLAGENALEVSVQEGSILQQWSKGLLSDASSEDQRYELSEPAGKSSAMEAGVGGQIEIGFGNGINGARPALGAQILVGLTVTAGAQGNVAGKLDWLLEGVGSRWSNHEPIDGGADASNVDTLLTQLRIKQVQERTLVTSAQIEAAAMALGSAYGIRQASIIEGWEPGRLSPATRATRTLIVARTGFGNETADWRRSIGRALRPRIALGEKLLIDSPSWHRFRIRVQAIVAAGKSPAEIVTSINEDLNRRISGSGEGKVGWPMGLPVTAIAIGGWIKRIPGVASVTAVTLSDDRGQPLPDNRLHLPKAGLPKLIQREGDVAVSAGGFA